MWLNEQHLNLRETRAPFQRAFPGGLSRGPLKLQSAQPVDREPDGSPPHCLPFAASIRMACVASGLMPKPSYCALGNLIHCPRACLVLRVRVVGMHVSCSSFAAYGARAGVAPSEVQALRNCPPKGGSALVTTRGHTCVCRVSTEHVPQCPLVTLLTRPAAKILYNVA